MPSKRDEQQKSRDDFRKWEELPENTHPDPKSVDIWKTLEKRKEAGLWDGEIEILPIKEYELTKGTHFYELTDVRKRIVTCTLCPIRHGGILEANLLSKYEIKNGIIYFEGFPRTRAPEKKRDYTKRKKVDKDKDKGLE